MNNITSIIQATLVSVLFCNISFAAVEPHPIKATFVNEHSIHADLTIKPIDVTYKKNLSCKGHCQTLLPGQLAYINASPDGTVEQTDNNDAIMLSFQFDCPAHHSNGSMTVTYTITQDYHYEGKRSTIYVDPLIVTYTPKGILREYEESCLPAH